MRFTRFTEPNNNWKQMQRQQRKPYRVHVQHSDGQVAYIPWEEAYDLNKKERAKFISNTLFKAAKAGIDIRKLSDSERNDRALKDRINERSKAKEARKEKKEKQKTE